METLNGIEHTQRALSAQNMITEKTNELLTRNAETLKMATVETAKEAERSVVDIATLKRCIQQLISSISEVVKIHEQGAKRRQDADTELVKGRLFWRLEVSKQGVTEDEKKNKNHIQCSGCTRLCVNLFYCNIIELSYQWQE